MPQKENRKPRNPQLPISDWNRPVLLLRVERPELGHRHPFRIAADLGECADGLLLLAGAEKRRAKTDVGVVHVDLVFLDAGLNGADRVIKLALTPELLADLDQRIA